MKATRLSGWVLTLIALGSVVLPAAQGDTAPPEGHRIEEGTLTFLFDPTAYELGEFESVAVKGNFNDYNAQTPGWQLADDDGDGIWTLAVALGEQIVAGAPFRFEVDGEVLEPPEEVDPDFLVSDGNKGYLQVIGGLDDFFASDPIASEIEARTFETEDGLELDYYLHSPDDYDPSQIYPLVLSLHGMGERGDSPAPLLPYNGAYEFMATATAYEYFMLVPQLPAERFWWEPDIEQALLAVITATQEAYPLDPGRVYIIGLSLGAFGLWDLVHVAPDTFAAGISICGGSPGTLDAARIAHIPFRVFHGSDDPVVPVSASQAVVAALEAAGGTVDYTEYEGAQHWIWVRTYTNQDVVDWLFGQTAPVRN